MTAAYSVSLLSGVTLGYSIVRCRFNARWYWLGIVFVSMAALQAAWIVIGWWWVAPAIVVVLLIALVASGLYR